MYIPMINTHATIGHQLFYHVIHLYLSDLCSKYVYTWIGWVWVWTGWVQVDVMTSVGSPMLNSSDIHMHMEFITL